MNPSLPRDPHAGMVTRSRAPAIECEPSISMANVGGDLIHG